MHNAFRRMYLICDKKEGFLLYKWGDSLVRGKDLFWEGCSKLYEVRYGRFVIYAHKEVEQLNRDEYGQVNEQDVYVY